ncbi:16S rRNA (adenine(1518)-N(6)/adenine(1519)-N(6))-dimethyltransferase RsmA [Metamycoplasma canadense]|uniref:Ribosomal RNA small subunit methyltransferase A n=1 Tax=Metamycoplasma canadense TaxID=29554 RepID=A0A077L5E7_9BACT|nr:16S rRNA (adenine(1518)-N(6)/adenine(1519)-N(6))-dimethyltransferase RsmA [Metamycoplasma canadense]BAP39480.1 dimethyladenosine transferase [Metamycoplasma canadense]
MEIKAKKSFGQNFLINKKIQEKIVQAGNVVNENVIEIGPGLGALTNLLIPKVKTLEAYELDKEIYNLWINKSLNNNIVFLNQDFLEANLISDFKKVIIGNIPYNITSLIIFKLIENYLFIKRAVIMVQKEVGERLIASPNSKNYSKLTVSLQSIAKVSKILIAKAGDFNPAPKVDSMVVKIEFFDKIDFDLKKFLDFVKLCFQFKRKTLVNNLLKKYDKEKIISVLKLNNIDLLTRPENLNVNQYKLLFNEFLKFEI